MPVAICTAEGASRQRPDQVYACPMSHPPSSPAQALAVLIIDDEKNIRATLAVCLEALGCQVTGVTSAEEAVAAIARQPFDMAFLDLRLGQDSGLDLLPRAAGGSAGSRSGGDHRLRDLRHRRRGHAARRLGLPAKPFTPAQIRHVVEQDRRARGAWPGRSPISRRGWRVCSPELELATESPRLRGVYDTIGRAAAADAPVLLRGETGTGKSLCRPSHSRRQPSCRAPLRGGQLPDAVGGAARQRAVRPRARGLHRRGPRSARARRGGPGRHAVSRRDRGDPAELAGQAATLPAGQGVRTGGRESDPPRRRARGGGHQPGPRGGHPGGAFPGGSAFTV